MSKSKRRKRNWALIDAVLLCDVATAQALLDEAADVNARDEQNDNETPLILAAQRSDAAMARLLLERGAEVEARDENGRTALLHAPILSEAFEMLLARGVDLHARDNEGRTKLILIIPGPASPEEVQELIARGIDISARDSGAQVALSMAGELGLVAVAGLLERAGATE